MNRAENAQPVARVHRSQYLHFSFSHSYNEAQRHVELGARMSGRSARQARPGKKVDFRQQTSSIRIIQDESIVKASGGRDELSFVRGFHIEAVLVIRG